MKEYSIERKKEMTSTPSLVGPTGVQLLNFCCSGVSVGYAVEYSSCFISAFNLDIYYWHKVKHTYLTKLIGTTASNYMYNYNDNIYFSVYA